MNRPSGRGEGPRAAGSAVDGETGEILAAPDPGREGLAAAGGGDSVEGERTIPSVNRERSMQSRISTALALATVVLLGAGFLFWYYGTQFARTREAQEAASRAAAARAAGEMKLPPLGRIDPPRTASEAASPPAPAAPAMPAAAPNAGTTKTPEQIALERQLGMPVLRRAPAAAPAAGAGSFQAIPLVLPGTPPAGSLPPSLATGMGGTTDSLSQRLQPTATPAAAARRLPAARMLLPKGAFIDCTLETAIDSTHPGMTTCIGASDVYGADGKVVLLERGTKYVGEQRGEPRPGQGRVFVLWHEARTPGGVVAQLASPGTDALGRSGLPGYVDRHFWERFGAAILVSVIDGAVQALAAGRRSGPQAGGTVVLNPQGGRDLMAEVLRGTVSIPPTVIKNQGERIQILVARDVDFHDVHAQQGGPVLP